MGDVIVRVADKETLDEIHDYLLDANPVYVLLFSSSQLCLRLRFIW